MQLEFWEQTDCKFPQVEADSAYRYGCRCPRCRAGHSAARDMSALCRESDCGELRLKGRRYCLRHAPENVNLLKKSKRCEVSCEICSRSHSWYESQLEHLVREDLRELHRKVCSGCRKRYMGAIRSHRLDSDQALRLLTATGCELCGERPGIDKHGRLNLFVDHDHSCCAGPHSCGRCVRGFLCPGCNIRIGHLEKLLESGLDECLAYVGHRPAARLPHS